MLGYNGSNDASANATFLFDDIEIKPNLLSNGVEQALEIDQVIAFPNPTKDKVKIKSANSSILNVSLYNVVGEEILAFQPNSLSTEIDLSNLPNGIYIAKISTGSSIGNIKLLKE
jgi:hypothetical protein